MERNTLLLSFDVDLIEKMRNDSLGAGYTLNEYIENILKAIVPVVEPIHRKVDSNTIAPFEGPFIEKNFKIVSYQEAEAAIEKAMNLTSIKEKAEKKTK